MSRERNIIWVNRLAWGHAILALCGAVKYAGEGNYWASAGWAVWACFMVAFARASPRQVW